MTPVFPAERAGAARGRAVPPLLDASWRVLLGIVVATLAALVVGPFLAGREVRALRSTITDEVDPARLQTSEVRAALATQMVALGEVAQGDLRAGAARYRAALGAERASAGTLDTLVAGIGPEARERLAELRAASAAWHVRVTPLLDSVRRDASDMDVARSTRRGAAAVRADSLGALADDALAAVDASTSLDRVLARVAADRRAHIARVERLTLLLPVVLAPFALGSAIVGWWAARRLVVLAEAAERGRRALADSAAARASLMRGVTHDLKNPLGAAQGYAELLQEGILGPLADEQRRTVARIHELIARTLASIRDLTALSATTAGTLPLAPEVIDVAAEARAVTDDFAAQAQAAGATLVFEATTTVSLLTTDRLRVRQVLGNLLSNACKYAPGGEIRVVVCRHDAAASPLRRPAVSIAVADEGPGIAAELQERVFEEFYRVPDARAQVEGNGVGLAISRRTARLLGGELTVASAPGEGSTFVLWLPTDAGVSDAFVADAGPSSTRVTGTLVSELS